jgi:hypothetical protein
MEVSITETHSNPISRFLSTSKLSLFGLFVQLNQNSQLSRLPSLLLLLIEFLQLLSFPFSTAHDFAWNSSYINWLSQICQVARFDALIATNASHENFPLFVFGICVGVVMLLTVFMIIVSWLNQLTLNNKSNTSQKSDQKKWYNVTLHYVLMVFKTILYLPLMSALLRVFQCVENGGQYSCDSMQVKLAQAVGAVSAVLLFVLTVSMVAFHYEKKFQRNVKNKTTQNNK